MFRDYSGSELKSHLKTSVAICVTLLVAGCTSLPAQHPSDADVYPIQWPAPPLPPRVAYLYSIMSPRDVNIGNGWIQKIWRGLVGRKQKRIGTPQAIHVDSGGRIYAIDARSRKIHVFDQNQSRYHQFPDKTVADFDYPIGISTDDQGTIFVTDASSHRVHVFSDFGKTYNRSFGSSDLVRPTGLVLRPERNELLVVDTASSRVAVFDASTYELLRTVGKSGTDAESLHYPTAIAVRNDGGVVITDSLNFRIQVLSSDLQFVSAFGSVGDRPGYFSRPKGIAIDRDEHIYVVDALFDNVQVFTRQGELLLTFGHSGHDVGEFWLPSDIYIDNADRIYITDSYNSRIQVFQYFSREN